jgi:hypothetical protein
MMIASSDCKRVPKNAFTIYSAALKQVLFIGSQVRQMYLQQIVSLKQLLEFLYVNQSKSETSEDAKPISTWLAEHLGSEVDSIRQELQVSI